MQRFRDFVLEEGPFLDAFCHGVKTGYQAYKQKRTELKSSKPDKKVLLAKMLASEGDDLKAVIKQFVASGYSLKNKKEQKSTDWLAECIDIKKALS